MFKSRDELPTVPPLTYSLRGLGRSSDRYYRDIATLANDVMEMRKHSVEPMLERLMEWIGSESRENLRSDLEYTFDILTLGVMWKLYGGRARRVPLPLACGMCSLYRLRRRYPSLKRWVDPVRGLLATHILGKRKGPDAGEGIPCLNSLRKLLHWMEATGEYREEVLRLHIVFEYLSDIDEFEREWYLENLLSFADNFMSYAESRLGEYTAWVDTWRSESAPEHRHREDYLLCDRSRHEYHLNMLGAELMNRAFAADFAEAGPRAVLLPACMRGANAAACKARRVDLDLVCTGCTDDCKVNAVRKMAAASGASAHIIPHSSDFTRWLRTWAAGRGVGVVGVACVTQLITGGLELRSLGIPAQCVLLDHCGCTQHWDPEGRQTELNGKKLDQILKQC